MINGKRIMGLVPARGGSKGIPHKNIIPLNNRPLISYTILAAADSKYIDITVVSTDDDDIAAVSQNYGAVVLKRPSELAVDNSKTIDAIMHAVNNFPEYDVLVLLQPTSPLRTAEDIDLALEFYVENNEIPLCSVCEVSDPPVLIRTLGSNNILNKILNESSTVRRQDMKKYYRVNGAIYINPVNQLSLSASLNDNVLGYIMPRERSVDIDEMSDIITAETILYNKEK